MLSNYCNNFTNFYGIKIGNVDKLVPDLGNETKFVFYYRNLHIQE